MQELLEVNYIKTARLFPIWLCINKVQRVEGLVISPTHGPFRQTPKHTEFSRQRKKSAPESEAHKFTTTKITINEEKTKRIINVESLIVSR